MTPAAFKGVGSLGRAGSFVAGGFAVTGSGVAIGEGAGNLWEAYEKGDPWRAANGVSLVALGSFGAKAGYDSWRVAFKPQDPIHLVMRQGDEWYDYVMGRLRGHTEPADLVGDFIETGDIQVNLVNRAGMRLAAKEHGIGWFDRLFLDAFQYRRDIFVPINNELLPNIVHEGGHATRGLLGTGTYTGARRFGLKWGDFREERAVRREARDYCRSSGAPCNSAARDYFESLFYLF